MNEGNLGSAVFWGLILSGVAYGLGQALFTQFRESAHNARMRAYVDARDAAFKAGFLNGRRWLARFVADAEEARDHRDEDLRRKSHPARKAADIVNDIKHEKRDLTEKLKLLEYQLASYEEYFPQLEEYRELILDERVPLLSGVDNVGELERTDPSQLYLSREEWEHLSVTKRNQLALGRYLARPKTNWEIGRFYERYLGYLRETAGWSVTYHGALHGFEDMGRDLVCLRKGIAEIVQAKCWSSSKLIHEKHLFQLFGTAIHYRLANPSVSVTPVLISTTTLSTVAGEVASALAIKVEMIALPSSYPLIKCNINQTTKEKIYHLPFDQQYDRTQVSLPGECYAETVADAESRGFRRAWRYHAQNTS